MSKKCTIYSHQHYLMHENLYPCLDSSIFAGALSTLRA